MKISGKIEATSVIKEYQGQLQTGFKIKNKWYNIQGTEEQLNEMKKTIIKKGNEIEFDADNNTAKDIKIISESSNTSNTKNWQDDIVNFETLLDEAYKGGLAKIETEKIEVDLENKYALIKARVSGKNGTFEAHGDATSENIGEVIKPHFIRMAETRAIARALRWYTNNIKGVEFTNYPNIESEPDQTTPEKKDYPRVVKTIKDL